MSLEEISSEYLVLEVYIKIFLTVNKNGECKMKATYKLGCFRVRTGTVICARTYLEGLSFMAHKSAFCVHWWEIELISHAFKQFIFF